MFIEFGIWNLKLLIPLLYPIAVYIEKRYVFFTYSFISSNFITCIGYFEAGLIYLIVMLRSRKINKTEIFIGINKKSAVNQIKQEIKEKEEKKIIKVKISIFLLILLYLLPYWINFIFTNKINTIINVGSNSIFTISKYYYFIFFSNLLLDEKMYKHRIISIIIITICNLILLIKEKSFDFEILSFLIIIMRSFCIYGLLALFYVLVKIHFNNYFTNPYKLMFYLGLFGLLILTPFEIIYYLFFGGNSEILKEGFIYQIIFFSKENFINFFLFFLPIISSLIIDISLILTIYYFTPCHLIFCSIISDIINRFIDWEKNVKSFGGVGYIVIFIVLNIIMSICYMIYSEIIIIKLWGLEKYTSKFISKREKIEFDDLDPINNKRDEGIIIRSETEDSDFDNFDDK